MIHSGSVRSGERSGPHHVAVVCVSPLLSLMSSPPVLAVSVPVDEAEAAAAEEGVLPAAQTSHAWTEPSGCPAQGEVQAVAVRGRSGLSFSCGAETQVGGR